MNKLEQRLSDLTRQLGVARENKDTESIESIEDEIDEVEFELEQEYENTYGDEFDD